MNVRLFNRLLNLNFNEILERAFVKFKFICEKLRRASSRVEKNSRISKNPPIPHTEHPALNKGRCAAQWKLSVNSAIFCWRFRISGREKQRMEGEKNEKNLSNLAPVHRVERQDDFQFFSSMQICSLSNRRTTFPRNFPFRKMKKLQLYSIT